MEKDIKELTSEELEQVDAGMGPPSIAPSHPLLIEQRQREKLAEMQLKMEQTADIRMRASEDALKATMRLARQEQAIKEAMKAQREELGLD